MYITELQFLDLLLATAVYLYTLYYKSVDFKKNIR